MPRIDNGQRDGGMGQVIVFDAPIVEPFDIVVQLAAQFVVIGVSHARDRPLKGGRAGEIVRHANAMAVPVQSRYRFYFAGAAPKSLSLKE